MKLRIVACILSVMIAASGSLAVSAQEYKNVSERTASVTVQAELEKPELTSCEAYGNQIVVKWNTVESAEGYYIYRKTAGGNWSCIDFVDDPDIQQYCDANVQSGVVYTYTVRAYAANQYPGDIAEEDDGISAAAYYLSTPVLQDAFIVSGTQVILHWNAVADAEGYVVYRESGTGSWQKIGQTVSGRTNFTDEDVTDAKQYRYTVRAYRIVNGTKYFSSYDRDGIAAVPYRPAAPTVKATGINKIKITWKSVTGADGYYLYRRKVGSSSWGKPLTTKSANASLSYTDKTAVTARVYEYAVQAYSGENNSDYALSSQVAAYQPTVTVMKSVKKSGKYLKVSWTSVKGASGYRIYRRTSSSSWAKLTDVSGSKTSFVDKKAKKNIRYYYKIRVFTKGNGKTYWSKDSKKTLSGNNGELPKLASSQNVYLSGETTLKVKNNKKKVTWKSTDTSIASVSSKGVVKGKKIGSVRVYAQIDGVKYYCTVKVKNAMTTTSSMNLSVSSRKTIPIRFKLNGKLSYRIKNNNIISARFGSWNKDKINLYVTARKKGTTTLTVTNNRNNEKLVFTIRVK